MASFHSMIEEKMNLKRAVTLLAGIILLLLAINAVSTENREFAFADTATLSGYAWSDNIGWVSLNCSDASSCGTSNYAISVDSDTGNLSGYAWSDNIGWISANSADVSGCPSGSCTPNLQGGVMTGWMRALANGGGWDGWISLSGSGYGVTQSASALTGYAWGSYVVGWLDFSAATAPLRCTAAYSCSGTQTILYTTPFCQTSTYATCTAPTFCSEGSSACLYPQPSFVVTTGLTGHLQVIPQLVSSGDTTQVHWNVDDVVSCTVTGTNGDSWTGLSAGTAGQTSSPIVAQTTYTLSCAAYPTITPPTVTETATVNLIPIFEEL